MNAIVRALFCGGIGGVLLGVACSQPAPAPEAATNAAFCQPRAGSFPPPAMLADWSRGAQLFEGLGSYQRKVTATPEAQRWFDQGLRLLYAFNHDESTRAFVKAGELDPACASCWWGAALTLGPNYNIPMLPDRARAAWDALQKAQAAAPKATPVEQALIAALARRYPGPEPLDPAAMQPHQLAFAQAMGEVAKRYPDDLDVQTLHAEALMTANPWKLWTLDGRPAPGTREIVAILEKVMARDPQHPGANHYYIHAVEASPNPGKALAAAQRTGSLMPAAGHLVHMPAHIWQRVGRYENAAVANRRGAEADEIYMKAVAPPGYYPLYLSHNYDFLSYSAAMQGQRGQAILAARQAAAAVPAEIVRGVPGMDFYLARPYFAMLRFGDWPGMLQEPPPPQTHPVQLGLYRYAQAYAQVASGQLQAARAALKPLDDYAARLPADLPAGLNSARDVLGVAVEVLAARIAEAEGDRIRAIRHLRAAIEREDRLNYAEPSDWYFPARHLLGAALLRAGSPRTAEKVYREDLRRTPGNGWALYGLTQALEAQRRPQDAAASRRQFETAWARADVQLAASAY